MTHVKIQVVNPSIFQKIMCAFIDSGHKTSLDIALESPAMWLVKTVV